MPRSARKICKRPSNSWGPVSFREAAFTVGQCGDLRHVIVSRGHGQRGRQDHRSFGSDDGIEVWLNGKRIHPNNASRGPAPDQDRVVLELGVGEIRLLVKTILSSSVSGRRLTLKLTAPLTAQRVTYLDSKAWNPTNLLYGAIGIAALTFCNVSSRSEGTETVSLRTEAPCGTVHRDSAVS